MGTMVRIFRVRILVVLRIGYLGLVAIGCCLKYQRSVRVYQAASAVISGLSSVDELVWRCVLRQKAAAGLGHSSVSLLHSLMLTLIPIRPTGPHSSSWPVEPCEQDSQLTILLLMRAETCFSLVIIVTIIHVKP